MELNKEKARELYKKAEETLFSKNITEFNGHNGKLVRISDCYCGVWLEHAYDAVVLASLYPECKDIAVSQANIFFENQLESGHLPCFIREDNRYNTGKILIGYRHIQECVSFVNICFKTYELTKDREWLKSAYKKLCAWDKWLCSARMTRNKGLIETFGTWDTGHDWSLRFEGMPNDSEDDFGEVCRKHDALPMITPDVNAVFYGDRMALSKMALELGLNAEAEEWKKKAIEVKEKFFELLYDEQDEFFYDLDKNDKIRKQKTIQIANVFEEHMLTQEEFDRIYDRYFTSEKGFKTPVPFPATAVGDPKFIKTSNCNTWNYFAQTLVALRAELWMDFYGKHTEYEELLHTWLCCFTNSPLEFGQEFDPLTGVPSDSSPNYSSALLFYIRAMRKLGLV